MGEADVSAQHAKASKEARLPAPDVDARRTGGAQGTPAQGPTSALGLTWAVRDRETFARFRASRARARVGAVTVTFVPGGTDMPPRVAYQVGRRVGGAVERNRVRRRLRAVIGEAAGELAPGSYLIGAGPSAASAGFDELRTMVRSALRVSMDRSTEAVPRR
jgi:ribonuclease P protein component